MNAFADVWFFNKGWKPHAFQKKCWSAMARGESGLLNAPTGYGKTYAIWFGILQNYYKKTPDNTKEKKGLHTLWITPLRALSKEILLATERVSKDLELDYKIALRTGDTSAGDRQKQRKNPPQALITTPESVHLLMASKGYKEFFKSLEFVIVDEWHELLSSKRGVMIELAVAHLKTINPSLKVWGISATIGNLLQAKDILTRDSQSVLIQSKQQKKIELHTIYPDEVEKYPWSGHLGIRLLPKVLPLLHQYTTTLLFTNTRSQAEIWYQRLLEADPELAGQIALHHGSLSEELRLWVEDSLHEGLLKAVICTSSLDLGVDFRSVDCVIQIGSPKGIARFLQRAGRSGHRPEETSVIYFLPTHSLETMEGASLRYALSEKMVEQRLPYIRSFDMLIQFMMTLAVSDGFQAEALYNEVIQTHCYESISPDEFNECLQLITQGGSSLYAYDEFHKVVIEDGLFKVTSRRIAMQHRLSIGAIVSDMMLLVKFKKGKYLGSVEEWFVSRLKEGDVFWFSGRALQLVHIKNNEVIVRPTTQKTGLIPSWQGGRLPISVDYGKAIRHMFQEIGKPSRRTYPELAFLQPLFKEQAKRSYLPQENELLTEYIKTKYGFHLFIYPYEGKLVHEGMAAILAYRISRNQKITFTIASNDYGFELLSEDDFFVDETFVQELLSVENIVEDIKNGVNIREMAKRTFRDVASVSGLIFNGYPGKQMKTKHLQANASLFFSVFDENEPSNLLYRQAYDEVYDFQLEIQRMQLAFQRINSHPIIFKHLEKLSPFAFPIFSESFRSKYSNEDWQARLNKLKKELDVE
ncbi:ligase-associated DNA damage response DEXH box helicase [Myroides ceti]|uniref:Ligase-associated DNA damage response DEXH box helicase n=1 Tax=Paenimyroides ceti TaxID=395087 RepID=A0ABT8CRE9_9FLAO|nr:ligase-associated DNA damage response DEXH box helicase [Paenimyroides ceti]MDN3705802.1 ligase-associated DNA damage response DEXH box helicase [Paenimyroides ceti]